MIMLSFGPTEKVLKLNSILEKNLSLCFAVPVHKMCTLLEVVLKKPVIFIIGLEEQQKVGFKPTREKSNL